MRDLEAIGLNVDACLLRARISEQWGLVRQLLHSRDALRVASASATGNVPGVLPRAQLVGRLFAAAERASAAGDASLGADIDRAARDLRAWYHLDPEGQ
jgi:hypothetical protein